MNAPFRPEPVSQAQTGHVRFMRDVAVNIPDPHIYASFLPEVLASALRSAWKRGRDECCVTPFDADLLRPYGLCCFRNYALTAFGMKVRKALMEMEK
jgi:hypothetical protein